jgi:hypothetical protein
MRKTKRHAFFLFLPHPFLAMIDRFLVDRAGLRSLSLSLFQLRSARFSTSSICFVKKRMPPKKAAAPEKKTLLGRPGNNLKIGIVGLFRLLFISFIVLTSAQVSPMSESLPFSMPCQKPVCYLLLLRQLNF